ncbi:MAG: FecR family protein [Rhodospirillales bacterium]|nr:FecR family protein [Rhodospirillales bacterium]
MTSKSDLGFAMTEKIAWLRGAGRLVLLLPLLWATVFASAPAPALAQESGPVGLVVQKTGPVTVLRVAGAAALQVGDPVFQADQLLTGPKSKVKIELLDGSLLALGADSEVAVSEYLLDPAGKRRGGLLDLLRGILRATVAPDSGGAFDIRTRIAVASTRATDWIVELTEEHVSVFVAEGQVEVTAYQTGTGVLLEPGFGTDVPEGRGPGQPKEWGQARVDEALARTSLP